MGLTHSYIEGQTPLDQDETDGLRISSIATKHELDEFEQLNIEQALQWTYGKKFKKEELFSEAFIRKLHARMFSTVWLWAGHFRQSEKNIGIMHHLLGTSVRQLCDDSLYWIEHGVYSEEEIAIRFKHRLVAIHCFSNGNGRHSRLMADLIMTHLFKKPAFNWSRNNLNHTGDARAMYLKSLRAADRGDIQALLDFALS